MLKNVYTVGQISEYISNMFKQDFMLKNISIKGEVSNCTYHTTGHIYFTIKDSNGVLKGVMFAGNRKNLQFQMKEGDQVVVNGSVESYKFSSQYQIIARSIELDGAGNLYLKLEVFVLSHHLQVQLSKIFVMSDFVVIHMCKLFFAQHWYRGMVQRRVL